MNRLGRLVPILRRTVRGWEEPVLGRIRKRTADPFRILVACVISLRTKDAVTDAAAARLFRLARTARGIAALPVRTIARAIYPCAFYRVKARQIRSMCRLLIERHRGRVPADQPALLSLPGVGLKTANLTLSEGFGQSEICVDIHVHRISNRLGLIRTSSPDESEAALRAALPRRLWKDWNGLLVPFGQRICQPVSPWCSRCPVSGLCPRRGVGRRR